MTTLYPLLKPPSDSYDSFASIHNFHPFPLSFGLAPKRYLYLVYAHNNSWTLVFLDTIGRGQSYSVNYSVLLQCLPFDDITPYLALSAVSLPDKLNRLNLLSTPKSLPAWRATLSITKGQASTSFQGECPIFPPNRSLMSFSPFIQGSGSDNFFYLVNLTDSPKFYSSELKVYDPCQPTIPLASYSVSTNSSNLIKLKKDLSSYTSLVFHCPDITGVPIFMSSSDSKLSMEHTHPAASFTLGTTNRKKISKLVGMNWSHYIHIN